MALIKCSVCGQMISDKAVRCPKCGSPVGVSRSSNQQPIFSEKTEESQILTDAPARKNRLYPLLGILAVALLGLAAWMFFGKDDIQTEQQTEPATSMTAEVDEKDDQTAEIRVMDLSGYVGQHPITMHLELDDKNANGYYYYNAGSSQLQLTGTINDNHIELNETTQEGRPTGHFDGMMIDGEYSGEFINYKGQHFIFQVSESE